MQRGIKLGAFRSLSDYSPFAVVRRHQAIGPQEPPMDRALAASRTPSLLARVREFLTEPNRS